MLFIIARILVRIFGLDMQKAQRVAIFVSIGAGVLLLLIAGLWIRSCVGKPNAKIDQELINKINSANEKEKKAELQKFIEENQDAVGAVGNRSTIADVHVAERNAAIDAKVKEADAAIAEAKRHGKDVTADELNCLLIPEACS